MRRVPFCSHKKEPKMRRGSGADELQAPRTRSRSKRLHPRTPIFYGAYLRTAPHTSRRPKSGHSKHRFSLSLVPTKGALPAALGRAPGWDGPLAAGASRRPVRVLRLPMERQQQLGSRVCRLTPTPEIGRCTILSWAPVTGAPQEPSEAGIVGRGRARERTKFLP